MSRIVVYFDAGHGGLDSKGNHMTFAGHGKFYCFDESGETAYEGVLNRIYASKIEAYLIEAGIEVVRVYDAVFDRQNHERVRIANEHFYTHKPEKALFVSQHFNAMGMASSGKSQPARGFSIFTSQGETDSDRCANLVYDKVEAIAQKYGLQMRADFTDGRNKAGKLNPDYDINFEVLARTVMPAFLAETAFFTNILDYQLACREDFQNEYAKVVAEGIVAWFGIDKSAICPTCKRVL
jgi:N-acetylmuramoyl-L-alanine amidase